MINFDCYVTNYNPIVCCLQETMLTKDDFIIQGFNCIHLTSRDMGGRACGGVSVLVRDGIPYSECKLYTRKQSQYPCLKLLLFVRCIYLSVMIYLV